MSGTNFRFATFVQLNTNMSSTLDLPIKLTEGAIKEILRLKATDQSNAGKPLRLGVKGGGCAGFSYILEFDTPTEKDKVYQIENVDLVVDPMHELYLKGMELDYQSGLNNRGFIFNNPNAETTCGCGSSFG